MFQNADRGLVQVGELAELVKACGTVFVAIALDGRVEPTVARYLTITDFAETTDRQRVWDYGPLLFIEADVPADQVARWLTEGRGSIKVQSEDVEFMFDPLPAEARSERHPGRSAQDSQSLSVPYRRYAIGSRVSLNSISNETGWLVGTSAPAFPDADAALLAFFFDAWVPGNSSPHEAVVARLRSDGPRIDSVTFAGLQVMVEIEDPSGQSRRRVPLRLDLAIGEYRASAEIWSHPWTASLDLPDAAGSQHWWLVLSEDHRWLDRRSADGIAESELHIDGASPAPDEEVAAWVSIGESVFLEFKRELPPRSDNARLCRTVAAFANGKGGTIVFGIDRDEATLSPVEGPYDSARDRLSTIIEGNLTEVPPFEIRRLETSAGLVIALEVGTGESPPYGVDKQKPIFYIRSNATTLPATAEQVRRLARASLRDQPGRGFPYA